MNLKNKLLSQANKTLGVKHQETALASKISDIDKLTTQIRMDLSEMQEIKDFVFQKRLRYAQLRANVLQNLIYIRDHKKELGVASFQSYLETQIGVTKGYFYEQVQAYELCVRYGKPEYFQEVDYKILVMISRLKSPEKQERLFSKAKELTRESFLEVSRADSTESLSIAPLRVRVMGNSEIRLTFSKPLNKTQRDEWVQFLLQKSQEL